MNFTGHDAIGGLHPRGGELNIEEPKKIVDTPLGAMTVQALESADRPVVIRLEIGRTAIQLTRVLLPPVSG